MKLKANLLTLTKLAVALVGVGIILAGCQSTEKNIDTVGSDKNHVMTAAPQSQQPDSDQPGKGEVQIVIENFVYSPADVTVAPGTKVTWINKDEAPHTATSTDNKFSSGGLDTGDKFSFVFNDKGDYPYFCTLHPHMKAVIKVK